MSAIKALPRGGFFRLWGAETISLAGSQVTLFALPLVAIVQLHASAFQVGLLAAVTAAASLLLGLSAGVVADRFERIGLMQLCNLARVIFVGAVPVLAWTHSLSYGVLLVIGFAVAAVSLVFDSARAATVPALVPHEYLPAANSWVQGSVAAADVGGPGIAAILVQVFSASTAMVADAVSYLLGALVLRGVDRCEPSEDARRERHRTAIVSGLRYLRRDRVQFRLAMAAGHYNFFHAMFFAVFTLFALRTLHFRVIDLGVVGTFTGAAGLLAVAIAAPVSRRIGVGPTMLWVYLLPGAFALLVPLVPRDPRWLTLVIVTVSQTSWTVIVVINLVVSESVKQVRTPSALLGRVSSATRFVSAGADPVGALMGGAVASSVVGQRTTLIIASIGLITSAVWPASASVRSFRGFDDVSTMATRATTSGGGEEIAGGGPREQQRNPTAGQQSP